MPTFVRSSAVMFALVVAIVPRLAAATTAGDLCPAAADPCVITADVNVGANSTLDFGTRAVDLKPGASLNVNGGSMAIIAGSLRLEASAVLTGIVPANAFGLITVTTSGPISIEANTTQKAKIDVSAGAQGGEIDLAASGGITVAGNLFAKGTLATGVGGTISLRGICADGPLVGAPCDTDVPGCGDAGNHGHCVSGDQTITGSINVSGNDAGGIVTVMAQSGAVSIGGTGINALGGEDGGGEVDAFAGTTLTTSAPINVNGGGLSGDGGLVSLDAAGAIVIGGLITGQAAGSTVEGGGTGADIEISSFGSSVRLNSPITAESGTPDGSGGSLDLNAATDLVQSIAAPISLVGHGVDSGGGDLTPSAGGNMLIGPADVSGSSGGGGSILSAAGGFTTVQAALAADGGGEIDLVTGSTVLIGAGVHANAFQDQVGGIVLLQGCDVTIPPGQTISSVGPTGENELRASGRMTIAGSVLSTLANLIYYLDASKPPLITGTVSPAGTPTQRLDLPPCGVQPAICGNGTVEDGEECDDGNNTACDGCSPNCRVERCGNGAIECGEQCDDGATNGEEGDPCSATCQLIGGIRYLPGSHTGTSGCFLEWEINNPNTPVVNGFPATTQHCIDGDPACDADGLSDGTCTFQTGICVNMDDPRLASCHPNAISKIDLLSPPPLNPSDSTDSYNADQIYQAARSLGTTVVTGSTTLAGGPPDTHRSHCSALMMLHVPHPTGLTGTRSLRAGATDDAGHKMGSNRMILACDPNPAVCGNGQVELGEECDDGNTTACDGCSPTCKRECGNGVVDCAEQCDHGSANGTPGDSCSARCQEAPPALRVPGGGSAVADCGVEWSTVIATPALLRNGLPKNKQICVDNDPTCDFDPTPGTCHLKIWACVGGADLRLACPATAITSIDVLKPTIKEPPANQASKAALIAQLGQLGSPIGPGEQCTGRIDVTLPAGRKLFAFKTLAHGIGPSGDRDSFSVACKPIPTP